MVRPLALVVAVGMFVVACDANVGGPPDLTPALGIVTWDDAPAALVESADLVPGSWGEGSWGDRPALVVPASVTLGVPFTVEVTTALPNACWQPGEPATSVESGVATITVYDHRSASDPCALMFSWATRQVDIQFDQAGEAMVRLVGRRVAGDDFHEVDEVVIEHTLTVN